MYQFLCMDIALSMHKFYNYFRLNKKALIMFIFIIVVVHTSSKPPTVKKKARVTKTKTADVYVQLSKKHCIDIFYVYQTKILFLSSILNKKVF